MFMDGKLYNCIKNIQRFLYPPHCLLCGQPGRDGRDLCLGCQAELPWLTQACRGCGAPLPGDGPRCGACLRRPPPFEASFIPFAYRPPLDRLILQLKFQRQLAVAPLLGGLMAEALARDAVARPEALLPVPMHPARLRERGFNQAMELARVLSRHSQIPLQAHLAIRQRHTAMQTRLDGQARRRNLHNAFAVDASPLPSHIALVDDVVTTGSTVSELARTLRQAGVARVDVWACARA